MFEGALDWWILTTIVCLLILNKLFNSAYEPIRNLLWNTFIELSFHKKQATIYEKALEKTSADMDQLSNRYRAAAQEAHALKDAVITDELTKVYNKRFFLNKLETTFATTKQKRGTMSLIMLDIDFFKKLNDTYGHLAGDDVLKEVAKTLKRFTPEQCYPCRYGGEEFGIILPNKGQVEAEDTARQIEQNIRLLRFSTIDLDLRVTVSQGICVVDFSTAEAHKIKVPNDLLEIADKQLYKSKENGRNQFNTIAMVRKTF